METILLVNSGIHESNFDQNVPEKEPTLKDANLFIKEHPLKAFDKSNLISFSKTHKKFENDDLNKIITDNEMNKKNISKPQKHKVEGPERIFNGMLKSLNLNREKV